VPRNQLGNAVSEIGDRQFADIIQPFLHEFGKITLGTMSIIPPGTLVPPNDQPMVQFGPNTITNMPDWMPGNIKDFKEIALRFVFSLNKLKNYINFDISAILTSPSSISSENFNKIP
jgi:hypothetical protein